MTKQDLFKKYSIDESHSKWEGNVDNWVSVEICRIMHDGKLPSSDDSTTKWVIDFLDKFNNDKEFSSKLMQRKEWGNLYLTAKRMVYRFHEQIIKESNG